MEEQDRTRRQASCSDPDPGSKGAPLPRRAAGNQGGTRRPPPRMQRPPHIAIQHPLPSKLARPLSQELPRNPAADRGASPEPGRRIGPAAARDFWTAPVRTGQDQPGTRDLRDTQPRAEPAEPPAELQCDAWNALSREEHLRSGSRATAEPTLTWRPAVPPPGSVFDPDAHTDPLPTAPAAAARPTAAAGPGSAGPAAEPAGPPPDEAAFRRLPPSAPSWPTVVRTTFRLWCKRRFGGAARTRRVLAAVALVAAVGIAVAVVLTAALGQPAGRPAAGNGHGQRGLGQNSATPASAAAVRSAAASWIARYVSPSAIVACDPVMFRALQKDGIPGTNLLTVGPTSDPLGADIVVATPAIRSQFGDRLRSVYAPLELASFGTGPARIDVRVGAADGAAAYQAAMAADVRARKLGGAQLLTNNRIAVAPAARNQLAAGQVDPRLLVILPVLATMHQVRIVGFAGRPPGAGPDVPLTTVLLAATDHPAGMTPASYQHWLFGFFSSQRIQYRPAAVSLSRAAASAVVAVRFDLPSPLGLLGTG